VLIFVQFGLLASIVRAAVLVYDQLDFDIMLVSPHYVFINHTGTFPRQRLYQATTQPGVASAVPLYLALPMWQNTHTHLRYRLRMMGFYPYDRVFLLPEPAAQMATLLAPDTVLIDSRSRPECGPLDIGSVTEVERRKVTIGGHYTLGLDLRAIGSIMVSEQNFARILSGYDLDNVHLGLVKVTSGFAPDLVTSNLRRALPPDVIALTRAELALVEQRYWVEATSTGIIFGTGSLLAFLVGAVVMYQVLATDITNHLVEYATLKGLGYSNAFLSSVVVQQALLLAVMGFIPALALSLGVYAVIRRTAYFPIHMTLERLIAVLCLTMLMCTLSALLAVRKVRRADPAELW
jgi:putative ABC transport system permease protein